MGDKRTAGRRGYGARRISRAGEMLSCFVVTSEAA